MMPVRFPHRVAPWALTLSLLVFAAGDTARAVSALVETIDRVQPRIVKIYGAGGFRGLEPYQSGFLISADGHVLTAWSYVLDAEFVTVTLDDGRQFEGKLVGADPRLEVAVLKIDAVDLPYFNLAEAVEADAGTRVLAFSNVFGVATGDEPASVLHGTVSALTRLEARRGAYETPYNGPAYVLDAMTNNPGAAGGALVNSRGELLAMLGKELRSSLTNTWLNYAIPIAELRDAVDGILAGNYVARAGGDDAAKAADPLTLDVLGLVLVPDVLERTPPFVDAVRGGSPAELAGVLPDDLVVFVGSQLVPSCKALREELQYIDRRDEVRLTVMRGQELREIVLPPAPEGETK